MAGRLGWWTLVAAVSLASGACGPGDGEDVSREPSLPGGPTSSEGTESGSTPASSDPADTSAPATTATTVPVTTTGTPPREGRDPVFAGDFPDPFVLYVDGLYYAYATQGSYGNVQMLRSSDLASWELRPLGALPEIPTWAAPYSVWAPAVVMRGDRFVLYYTALEESSGLHCVSAAVSDSPEGPFTDVSEEPFVCPRGLGGAIDPSPVTDRNGDQWLLWKNDGVANGTPSAVYAQRLDETGLDVVGDATLLIGTDQTWETPHVEAPSMIDAGDRYVLIYSGNWWNTDAYGVGFAVCESVAGPCTKPLDGPILTARPDAAGPGGAEFFTDAAGDPWVAYHAWLGGVAGYPGRRALWVERVDLSGEVPVLQG